MLQLDPKAQIIGSHTLSPNNLNSWSEKNMDLEKFILIPAKVNLVYCIHQQTFVLLYQELVLSKLLQTAPALTFKANCYFSNKNLIKYHKVLINPNNNANALYYPKSQSKIAVKLFQKQNKSCFCKVILIDKKSPIFAS